jgi:hypothetical protein
MPGGKPYKKPVSKAQARLFGAAAGGQIPGFSPADARKKLEGVNEKKLPATAPKRKRA